MTERELTVAIAAVLTTALEVQPCPESMVYLALGSDMEKWETVRGVLTRAGWVTISGHSIGLTPKGMELAEKCQMAVAR